MEDATPAIPIESLVTPTPTDATAVKSAAKRGRPTIYSKQLADSICKQLADGWTLRAICRQDDHPAESTVRGWALDDTEGFFAQYARARDIGLDAIADQTFEIADTPLLGTRTKSGPHGTEIVTGDMVDRSKLQVDTRKWYLSKLAPKRYGDKLEVVNPGNDDAMRELAAAIKNSPE
jgi:hypothetical protein